MSTSRQDPHGGSPPRRGGRGGNDSNTKERLHDPLRRTSRAGVTRRAAKPSSRIVSHTTTPTTPATCSTCNCNCTPGKMTRKNRSPNFSNKLRQMGLRLAPLVQMTTGAIHPNFPPTLLSFWLLSESQLDDLARFYHQSNPGPWTMHYPCPITWSDQLSIEEKRRKIGKFIGLRGCHTPTAYLAPPFPPPARSENDRSHESDIKAAPAAPAATLVAVSPTELPSPHHRWLKTEEQIEEDARRARLAADDDEALRKKAHWYA